MAIATLRSPEKWIARFGTSSRGTVVTVGNFDGVHLGHREILRRVVARARQTGALSVVATFTPHPFKILRPSEAPPLLMTLEQRIAAFEAEEVDAVLVLTFDAALAHLSPQEFVRKILSETLAAQAVLVGENFRFGYRHAGDVNLLRALGKSNGFDLERIPAVSWRGTVVSSTAIRAAIRDGHLIRAGRMLGRPYTLSGEIESGRGEGRRVIVPTLNLRTEQELVPLMGVYATEVWVGSRSHRAVTNVGVRPTFGGESITIESYLFDFNADINSGPMEVRFWKRLRDEMKFPGPEALRTQIQIDERRARQFFRLLNKFSLKKQSA